MFKSPLFYINLVLLVMIVSLALSVNVSNSHLPNFLKKAIAQVQSITGSGTTNYLAVFGQTSPSYTIGNSIIYDNGTNVGIGTTNPLVGLDIAGGRGIQLSDGSGHYVSAGLSTVTPGWAGLHVGTIAGPNVGGTGGFFAYDYNTNTAVIASTYATRIASRQGFIQFNASDNPSQDLGRMWIMGNGNVGINTTSPSQRLEVVGNGKFGRFYVVDTQYGGGPYAPGIGTDGTNTGVAANGGGFYVLSGPSGAYGNTYGNDYWINSVGKWASQMGGGFGSWSGPYSTNTAYTAATDGFVVGYTYAGGDVYCGGYIDTPLGVRRQDGRSNHDGAQGTYMVPVRKGDTWQVTDTGGCGWTIYWLPAGS